jgi:hypothetical protein
MPKRTDAQMVRAIRDARGLVAVAARKLQIDRQTIYNRMQKSDAVKDAVAEAREFVLDVAEAKLMQAVEAGEPYAICFTLKCLGKARGYVETQRHELTGKDGGPIETREMSDEELIERAKLSTNRVAALSPNGQRNGKH